MRGMLPLSSLILAACATLPAAGEGSGEENVPVQGESGRICNAAPAKHLVGRPATAELGAEALRVTGSGNLRWIRPGDIVTMEFRADRLNIELDAQGRVTRLRCG